MNAIPLQAASMNLMQILGPAAGGFLIDWTGAGIVYLLMAAMYGISIFTLFRVKAMTPKEFAATDDRSSRTEGSSTTRKSALGDLASGMRYILRDPVLLSVLSFTLVGSMLGMPIRRLLPGYVSDVFTDSGTALGIMQMAMGVGALAGALALATVQLTRYRGLVFAASALLMGGSLILFAATDVFWIAWIGLLIVGIGTTGRQPSARC